MANLILNPSTPEPNQEPQDSLQGQEGNLGSLDLQDLSSYLITSFQNAISDKEEYGWVAKREYDIASYYGIKNKALSNWPWKGSSNYPVPITPTLLDTGTANIKASIYSKSDKLIRVRGVGVEDVRKAPFLEQLLNWQVLNEIDMSSVLDNHIFRSFLHGTGLLKVFRTFDYKNNETVVKIASLDIENFFVPIDAKGSQVGETDFIHHIIPLTYTDVEFRKTLGVYKDFDKLKPGANVLSSQEYDRLVQMKDIATGTSLDQKNRRDNYFISESYCSYCPKSGSGYGGGPSRAGVKPIELIVTWSPNGGTIHRLLPNEDKVRPFAETQTYPNPGRFYAMSMPEKIRHIQEKANYADKQNTDALDRAISPAGFADDTDMFDKNIAQRVPGGIYPRGRGVTIEWEPTTLVDRGFERQYLQMWHEAERLTGLTEVTQGLPTKGSKTLGETQILTSRADIRFSQIFDRFESGWRKAIDILYYFDNKWMPRDKKIKVLGYADFKSIDELFPNDNQGQYGLGLTGKFDFEFAGAAVTEIEQEKNDMKTFVTRAMFNPLVANNPASLWKLLEMDAEAHGIRNIETKISKPKEASILSAEEAIERIVSGQYDLRPRPDIDAESYIFEIENYRRSEGFQGLTQEAQAALMNLLRAANMIRAGQMRAMMDLELIRAEAMAQQQAQSMQQMQPQGGQLEAPRTEAA